MEIIVALLLSFSVTTLDAFYSQDPMNVGDYNPLPDTLDRFLANPFYIPMGPKDYTDTYRRLLRIYDRAQHALIHQKERIASFFNPQDRSFSPPLTYQDRHNPDVLQRKQQILQERTDKVLEEPESRLETHLTDLDHQINDVTKVFSEK